MTNNMRGKGGILAVVCVLGLVALGAWVLQGRRQAGGGCCGGGALGAPRAQGTQESVTAAAEKAALAYAGTRFGRAQGMTAKATDYGCHIGVDVYRDGKVALRLAYRGNGRVEEI